MMRLAIFVCCVLLAAPAHAHPDGAPWGSADPDTFNSCAACHFDHEPVGRSPAIVIAGLPDMTSPGEAYELTLRFDAGAAPKAGFLLSATSGAFEAIDEFLETRDGEVRSIKTITPENGVATWTMRWRAGETAADVVTFHVGANAADDDRSPFGDKLHFRKFEVWIRGDGE